jgi:hypothetical protein
VNTPCSETPFVYNSFPLVNEGRDQGVHIRFVADDGCWQTDEGVSLARK